MATSRSLATPLVQTMPAARRGALLVAAVFLSPVLAVAACMAMASTCFIFSLAHTSVAS